LKIDVLGVRFDNLAPDEAVTWGAQLLEQPGFHYVVTPNPEFLLEAEKDRAFQDILNAADLVLPDGVGVLYCAKVLGTPLKARVPGIDFAGGLLQRLARKGGRLYLLGAKPGVAVTAGERLKERYPGLVVCGCHDGYFTPEQEEDVAREVRDSQADMLFVCLGAPKQEKWMARFGPRTGARLAIGLGGALDVFAGNVERAPQRWQDLGLEWAYRLKKEPQRLGRMARLPLVLVKAGVQRLSGGGGRGNG